MKAVFTFISLIFFAQSWLPGAYEPAELLQGSSQRGKTTVYLVRHAEKVISDPQDKDPTLTAEGVERAEELRKYFRKIKVDALYSTDYQRTRLTLAPLAKEKGKEIQIYSSRNHEELVDKVLTSHKGQTLVIAGHSNSLINLLKTFKAETEIKEISEDEYSYLFKLSIDKNNQPTLKVGHYGKRSVVSAK